MKESLIVSTPIGAGGRGLEFLGELDNTFMTYQELSEQVNFNEGYLFTDLGKDSWLNFKLDGTELIVSKTAVRYYLSFDSIYSKGLVYGANNTGPRTPTGLPSTNQLKTININNKIYKIRLLKGGDTDLVSASTGYDLQNTRNSEFSNLFYPIVIDDPNISSYTGVHLANYKYSDLGLSATVKGSLCWCQETKSNQQGNRMNRGQNGPSYCRFTTSSSGLTNIYGWRPCLELIG